MKENDLELIRDYLDGRLGPEGLERLNQLLESETTARAEFRALATMEEGLRDLSVGEEIPFPAEGIPEKAKHPRLRVGHLGMAAMFVLFLGLAAYFWQNWDKKDEWGEAIAKIEYLDEEVAFAVDHQLPEKVGSLLGKGWIQLQEGRARILFRSGATVEMAGPTSLGLDTSMRAYLESGKVTVHAPESARDFVVATESMEVVDLGTKFQVGVDPQTRESNVSVIEGLVDLHLGSRGAERKIQPLEAGYAARVDVAGKIVEITNSLESLPEASHDLLAHWTFDHPVKEGTIKDSGGKELDGFLPTEKQLEFTKGVNGQALAFGDGVSVDLGKHLPTLALLEDFTFTAWIQDPGDTLAMLFSLSGESEQHRVQFFLSKRFVRYGWQNGSNFDIVSGGVDGWAPGKWYHVAVSAKGNVIRLYKDGELVGSDTVGSHIGTPTSNPSMVKNPIHAYLGWLQDARQGEESEPQGFKGQMDDVQLYSGALGHEGIRYLYQNPGKTSLHGKQ